MKMCINPYVLEAHFVAPFVVHYFATERWQRGLPRLKC